MYSVTLETLDGMPVTIYDHAYLDNVTRRSNRETPLFRIIHSYFGCYSYSNDYIIQ